MSESRKYQDCEHSWGRLGNEVIPEGQRVLEHLAELSAGSSSSVRIFPLGFDYYAEPSHEPKTASSS